MWIWRKMEKISRTEKVSNEEVLRKTSEERSLIKAIKERQARWLGHVFRHDGLLNTIIEGRLLGKRSRGRPRKGILDNIKERRLCASLKTAACDRSAIDLCACVCVCVCVCESERERERDLLFLCVIEPSLHFVNLNVHVYIYIYI